jgi:hypothetical protein
MELPDERATLLAMTDALWQRAMADQITAAEAEILGAGLILVSVERCALRQMGLYDRPTP